MWSPVKLGSNVPGAHWQAMPSRRLHLVDVDGKRLAAIQTFGARNHLLDLNMGTYSTTHGAMYAAEKLVKATK